MGAVADLVDIGRVDVFGVSWGGAAAQQFAHDFPGRTRSLVLAATSAGFVMVPGDPRVLIKLATPKRYTDPGYMLKIGPDTYGGRLRHDAQALRERTDSCTVPAAAVVAEAMVALVVGTAYRDKFGGDAIGDAIASERAYRERIGWTR